MRRGGAPLVDEPERAAAVRRLALRWGGLALAVLVLLGAWRSFLLFCPLRDWPVLGWSLGPAAWSAAQMPALVAENALENGGSVGTALGRRLYGRTLVRSARAGRTPPAYGAVRLPYVWDGATGVWWCVEAWTGQAPILSMNLTVPLRCPPAAPRAATVLVRVYVQAHLGEPVGSGRCAQMEPVPAAIERDYLVVRSAAGWRVANVYSVDPGLPLVHMAPPGAGTAEALLAGCG